MGGIMQAYTRWGLENQMEDQWVASSDTSSENDKENTHCCCSSTCLAILHLLIAEALPFFIFYASFLDVLTSIGSYLSLWSYEEDKCRPGEIQYCVTNDYWYAAFIPTFNYK